METKLNDSHLLLPGAVTVFTATKPAQLGKVYSRGDDGSLVKDVAGHMIEGRYEVKRFSTVEDLAALLSSIDTNQAISGSLPVEGLSEAGAIASKKLRAAKPDEYQRAVERSKTNFTFRQGTPGVLSLDYDPRPGVPVLSRSDLWEILQLAIPGIEAAGVLAWSSGSSHIYYDDRELQGVRGQRLYAMVQDAADVPRVCGVLSDRLWLAGYGWICVSDSGARLHRQVFDEAMREPARLDFVGGAVCKPPLVQRRGSPEILTTGGFLDTRVALPALTRDEAAKVEALKRAAYDAATDEAAAVRARWETQRTEDDTNRLVRRGVPYPEARERAAQAVRAAAGGGVLLGDFEIVLENGDAVTVGDVLDDRLKYHGATCRDPLEPEYHGGAAVAKLFLFGSAPRLHSFAHGSTTYRLHRQPARIYLAAGRRAETASEIAAKLDSEDDLFLFGGLLTKVADGRLVTIRDTAALAYLVGTRFALYRKANDGRDVAADLDSETGRMVFAAIGE